MGSRNTPAAPPFEVDPLGFPTQESVVAALEVCGLGALATLDAELMGKRDKLAPLIANNCLARHLVKDWPEEFQKRAITAVKNAQS